MMDGFTGWPADGPQLLAEIAADNRADAWGARHETAIRAPMQALAADLAAEFGPVRVFRARVNRRFRPDAPPLRTDTGGVARSAGGCRRAAVLSSTGLAATVGHWRFDAVQMRRYRAAVAEEEPGEELASLLALLAGAGLVLEPDGEMRGFPRGRPRDHPRIALLRRRGLQVGISWELGPWLSTPQPRERVRAAWRAAAPLVGWLDARVGPPAVESQELAVPTAGT